MPFGPMTVLSMSGASPGGVAVLAVVPEAADFAFAAFGNDPRAMATARPAPPDAAARTVRHPAARDWAPMSIGAEDLAPYAGTYRSNQLRVDVRVVDGELEETTTYEPIDDQQARIFAGLRRCHLPAPTSTLQTRGPEPVRASRDGPTTACVATPGKCSSPTIR